MSDFPNNKNAAKAQGVRFYFTGIPCQRGHVAKRYLTSHCSACRSEEQDLVRSSDKNNFKKRQKLYKKTYEQKNKEKIKLRRKPEYAREAYKKWYAKNKEKAREKERKWRAGNQEAAKAISLNRVSRKRSAEGFFSKNDIKNILKRQNNKCSFCNIELLKYHVDHIIPLAKGGSNWPENLQIMCPSCNCSKGAKDFKIWKEEILANKPDWLSPDLQTNNA